MINNAQLVLFRMSQMMSLSRYTVVISHCIHSSDWLRWARLFTGALAPLLKEI